jgi:hypothetical protein
MLSTCPLDQKSRAAGSKAESGLARDQTETGPSADLFQRFETVG